MEKQKITEIKITQKAKRKERDQSGKLVEVEKSYVKFKEVPLVDGWPRFGHYLIDTLIYYAFTIIAAIPLVFILMTLGVKVSEISEDGSSLNLIMRLINYVIIYPGYYLLFESTMQSTPGKLIMGRIVVNEYGEKPTFNQILKRAYIRVIPFEAFSCLSDRGWHDSWTDTYVIRTKDLKELQLSMQIGQIDDKTHMNEEKNKQI